VDKTADYFQRGRPHHGLNDSQLIEAFKDAFRAFVADPSFERPNALDDLRAEIEHRGLKAPLDESASESLILRVLSYYEAMSEEARAEVNEQLTRKIEEFKNDRNRSN